MDQGQGSKKKPPGWAPYLSACAALLGAIAAFINPTKLTLIVLIILIVNAGFQFKYILKN